MLVDATSALNTALKNQQALGAFNVSSLEAVQAVFEVAAEVKRPVIIQTSAGEATYLYPELLTQMCNQLATLLHVEYILHLDRGNDLALIERCLRAGYNSVSSEFALSSFDLVVAKTLEVRKLSQKYHAAHEGALEIVPLRYYRDSYQSELKKTDPHLALKFVTETEVNSLAISIGNQSGGLKLEQELDFPRLQLIHELLPQTPLVLHGGSFLDRKTIKSCINAGVAKINVNTEVRQAYSNQLRKNLNQLPTEYAPYRLLVGVKDEMKHVIKNKMMLFSNSEIES